MAGMVFSLGLALGVAYLRESHSGSIRTEVEVEALTGVPNVASIPRVGKPRRRGRSSGSDEIILHPTPAYSEAIRRLYLALQLASRKTCPLGPIMITSAEADVGKSTLALSLARVVAASGQRVVVVDTDFHDPELHKLAALPNNEGFSDLIIRSVTVQTAAQPDPISNCHIVTSGSASLLMYDRVLNSDEVGGILQRLQEEFDLVIIDAPPLNLYAHLLVLAHEVSTVLFVVRAGATTPAMLRSSMRQISRLAEISLFTVLNYTSK